MLRFLNIASGSKGNATLIYNEDSLILLDMGITKTLLLKGLRKIKKKYKDINGVLITHAHYDHIKGLRTLGDDFPMVAGEGVLEPRPNRTEVHPGDEIHIGSFIVFPFRASHDSTSTMGYLISHKGEKLVYLTDTGVVLPSALPYMVNAEYYIIESNHDYKMLMQSNRPFSLKSRIAGDIGHLSNVDSALAIMSVMGDSTRKIYLAHLSEECNTPSLAVRTYMRIFKERDIPFSRDNIIPLKQYEMTLGGQTEW